MHLVLQVEKLVVANKELVKVYLRKDVIGHDSLEASKAKDVCVESLKKLLFCMSVSVSKQLD